MQAVDDDEPLTLADACREVFKNRITPASLRAEAARGRLVIEKVGRRHFVTRAAIREMRRLCQLDVPQKDHASGSSQNESASAANQSPPSGSSATARTKLARDAALLTLEKLNASFPATSRKSMSRAAARVIPLRSTQQTS